MNLDGIDCVVVGYNELDFDQVATRARRAEKVSAFYADLKLNSVLLDGKRLTYMELLNRAITAATGRDPRFNVLSQASLGVCHLTSSLRRRGLRAEYVNLFSREQERLLELLAGRPRTVAITTTFYVENDPVIGIVDFVRAHSPETKIVVGGPHIFNICSNHDPETQDFIFQSMGADIYVFDSQGESALAALARALRDGEMNSLAALPNLIYTTDGKRFTRTPRVIENNDLDGELVDWASFDPGYLQPAVSLRTARSCPFACSFCNFPTLAGEHVAGDVDVILSQLRYLRDIGVGHIAFIDDTFNVPLPRFKRLLRGMIEQRLDLKWTAYFRCSNADDESFELMARSGCAGVFLGIESGDPGILKTMNKFANVERYRYGIRRLEEHGIFAYASMIVGFPGETEQSVRNSVELIRDSRPSFYLPQIYYHDVSAPIHRRARELGVRGAGYGWQHATMSWRDAAGAVRSIYEEIDSSQLIPTHGMSSWGAFYLLGQGVSMSQLRSFLTIARRMTLAGLDEREAPAELNQLVALFQV